MLFVTAPVAEAANPHQIEIKAGANGMAIAGSSKKVAAA